MKEEMLENINASLYRYVRKYAEENGLHNTKIALPMTAEMMSRIHSAKDENVAALRHCLYVCRMLIDLHIPFTSQEEDVLLASSLCHILPENISFRDMEEELTKSYHLDHEVYETVKLIYHPDDISNEELKQFYDNAKLNKLALLVLLADRGNLVEQLYGIASWNAHRYIYETRTFYLPMCIYAKEHYHELLAPVSILMEKMRNLTETAEILLNRYEARENELVQEILALQEENATLKGIIQKLNK